MPMDDSKCDIRDCDEDWCYMVPDPAMNYEADIALCRNHYQSGEYNA